MPDAASQQESHLWGLMGALGCADVEDLHRRAIDDPAAYYGALVRQLGIRFSSPYDAVLDVSLGREFPRWFVGGRMNIVDSCLRDWPEHSEVSTEAVVTCLESGERHALTRRELRNRVEAFATWLRSAGVVPGDCVGLFMPMVPEATVAFLACAWVGAVAVPAFSGYGPDALGARFRECRAKVLVTADGFSRRGSWVDMASVAIAALNDLPSIEHVVCLGTVADGEAHAGPTWVSWSSALAQVASAAPRGAEQLDPNAPLLLMYTSGTTGRPKGIVHSHAGFLVKVAGDFAVAFDMHESDKLAWVTDLGWLVGPMMMVGNAAVGSTAVYVVGSIDHPDLDLIWRTCEHESVTVLGISPTAIRTMAATAERSPARSHDLSAIRAFLSTGEPWDRVAWRWLFNVVGEGRRPILNYSGGTEIGGGILTGYAALPVGECAFTGPVIGMDADVVNGDGTPIVDSVGELVIRNLWPGMTHSFWGSDDQRYLEAYWTAIPGVWAHGDLSRRDRDGWWYVSGRSDDTITVAGRRVGPGEIEAAMLECPGVREAAVVGLPDEIKGQVIVGFVVPDAHDMPSADTIIMDVARRLGRSLAPSRVFLVEALPRTRNGKILRRTIRARVMGTDPGDLSSLETIESLDAIPIGSRGEPGSTEGRA